MQGAGLGPVAVAVISVGSLSVVAVAWILLRRSAAGGPRRDARPRVAVGGTLTWPDRGPGLRALTSQNIAASRVYADDCTYRQPPSSTPPGTGASGS